MKFSKSMMASSDPGAFIIWSAPTEEINVEIPGRLKNVVKIDFNRE